VHDYEFSLLENRLLTSILRTFNIGYESMLKLPSLKVSILTSIMKTDVEIHYTTLVLPKTDVI